MKQYQASIWQSNHSLAGKLIRWPLRLIPHEARMRVLTGVNKGALWVVGSGVHHCWLGSYEKDKQDAVKNAIRAGMHVWDVGANVGFYTLAFSRLVGPSGAVVAFEPDALNSAYLMQHVRLNNCQNALIVQAAVCDADGLVSFSSGEGSFVGAITAHSQCQIPSVSLDSYFARSATRAPDVIKIDVEGAEADVLRGASRLLSNHSPEIWLALHNEQARHDCSVLLKKHGYVIRDLSGRELSELTVSEVVANK